jgi:hypothetical protein
LKEVTDMKLALLLKLQIGYIILGIGYNLVSLLKATSGSGALSPTSPALGAAVLLLYGVFLLSGYFRHIKLYRILTFVAFIALGYGGVVTHILNYAHLELYSSPLAWFLAIGINLFGAFLNLIAFTGKFKTSVEIGNEKPL